MRFRTHPRGLGDSDYNFGKQFSQGATQGVNLGMQTANQTGSTTAGAIAGGLALAASLDPEPFSKAALAIGAALTGIVTKMLQGCGQTCVDASNYVNEAEPYMVQNLQNYFSGPRTRSLQAQALANFDNAFNAIVQKCQQIGGLGGTNCIKDRQAGACKWKATPWVINSDGTFTPAGAAGSGSTCWNWVYGYRDPIASDPYVQADPATDSITDTLSGLFGSGGGAVSSSPLLLIGGGLLALYLIAGD